MIRIVWWALTTITFFSLFSHPSTACTNQSCISRALENENEELFTYKTFLELLKERNKREVPLIVACVHTKTTQKNHIDLYECYALLEHWYPKISLYFSKDAPLLLPENPSAPINPSTMQTVSHAAIYAISINKKITHIGSLHNLLQKDKELLNCLKEYYYPYDGYKKHKNSAYLYGIFPLLALPMIIFVLSSKK